MSRYTVLDSARLYMSTWNQAMFSNLYNALLLLLLSGMVKIEFYSNALQNKKHAGFVCQICIWLNVKKKETPKQIKQKQK